MERQAPGEPLSSTSGENIVAGLKGQVRVLLPMPVGDGYDYAVPEEMTIAAGLARLPNRSFAASMINPAVPGNPVSTSTHWEE